MAEEQMSAYTQGLLDTVVSLHKEVDNLRTAYGIVHSRIDALIALAGTNSKDALKEAVDIEELARLAVVAADVAHKAAVVLIEAGAIEKTQNSLTATQETYDAASASVVSSKGRQSSTA